MPSVFTLTGPRCTWLLAKGQVGHRKFTGCYETRTQAERAAEREGPGWVAIAARPPGVPMQGRRGQNMKTCRDTPQFRRARTRVAQAKEHLRYQISGGTTRMVEKAEMRLHKALQALSVACRKR
jgi:hypothetical protein